MALFPRSLPVLGLALVFSGVMAAQMTQIEGQVKDENGQPVKDAQIRIERKDIKGTYNLKTKKDGKYLHAGLQLGTYRVALIQDDKEVDSVDNVKTKLDGPVNISFDLAARKKQVQALAQAAETGNLTKEQARDMSPEAKAALEKQLKERQQAMAKNKELNDAFNAGMTAVAEKNWDVAAQSFTKAGELDPKQHVVWGQLGDVYSKIADGKTGADKEAELTKSIDAYNKAIELIPTDTGYRNNLALVYAKAGKFPEMEQQITQAVQVDPTKAGQLYFNLGAVLTNAGKGDAACEAFKKAIAADASYAEAHYQYGMCLVGKATAKPDGTMVFPDGTAETFQAYLSLKPDGANAESAKALLATMGTKLDTTYTAPGAKKPSAPAKRKP